MATDSFVTIGKPIPYYSCRSETPESIETKIGQNDYVMGPLTLPIFVEIGPVGSAPHIAEI